MTKGSQFICQQCGYAQVGWAGKCPNCGVWGSLVETVIAKKTTSRTSSSRPSQSLKPQSLSKIKTGVKSRIATNISEFDRVLGGGIVMGQVILLAGEPGIGKSTLLLQVSEKLESVMYASGEESAMQVKLRADRLGIKAQKILFLEETNVDSILEVLEENKPELIIIDSIQTMSTSDLSGLPGSVGQVRECASRLLRFAKQNNIPLIMVGHVTKEGAVAGPAVLAHIVDTVLWFEGDKSLTLRLLRSVKNRFGSTDEVGIFKMEENGLQSVGDEQLSFMSKQTIPVAGSATTAVTEGSRVMLVEIQSLVVSSKLPYPKRVTAGIDSKRVELILAILTRRAGLRLLEQDVYVNVTGGIIVREPAVDLAVALSVASAYFDKALPQKLIAVGELGLLGEVREVPRQEKRIKDAKRLGFNKVATQKEYPYLSTAIKTLLK